MQSFQYFGRLSGYQVNMSKTQLLKYNYTPSEKIKSKYHLAWQSHRIIRMKLVTNTKENRGRYGT